VPGFDRLSGLMVMIGCSFAIALVIQKTRIFIFFGGSIERLFGLAIGVFALLKWGMYMLFRSPAEPKKDAPKFRALSRRGPKGSLARRRMRMATGPAILSVAETSKWLNRAGQADGSAGTKLSSRVFSRARITLRWGC